MILAKLFLGHIRVKINAISRDGVLSTVAAGL